MGGLKQVLAVITARGGSKGIPRKNVVECGGKPLLAWTIEAALQATLIDRLVLSTDDSEIAMVGRKYGADVPFRRPSQLAGDKASHAAVVRHAVDWLRKNENLNFDYLALIQPTSPLILASDIDGCVRMALETGARFITVFESTQHPFFSRRMLPNGTVDYFIQEGRSVTRRQDLPEAYAEAGAVFVVEMDFFLKSGKLEDDFPLAYVLPEERSLDIDTSWDLFLADLILNARRGHTPSPE